ncbi:haloacid dehalogenase-like hydrolase [Oceanobacillus halophilus]|uniref:Haloacid dehalogenase-like hydrolase n=1 Tax=Oceanobacillus halophilus TaxID=930130 RepID=A0A494ZZV6_9BACI|nr:haloacid dehalogenase-like hydrolase [Oceanobacillus halophilus]RKQ32520.1 haloacid dehalogenase-like hydrolase [Oceanobacillus halophilus]
MKRILDCTASDFEKMGKEDLLQSIKASEGRTLIAEVVCQATPVYPGLTNAEYASAFGADLILLNYLDVYVPNIEGLENVHPDQTIHEMKKLVGRPVGMNLEPVDTEAESLETLNDLPEGRKAIPSSLKKAKELGVDFICLTGNPKTGVTNKAIKKSIKAAKELDLLVIAGKMHGAGVKEGLAANDTVKGFVYAGADIVLLPGVGTVPGVTLEKTQALIDTVHDAGAIALTTIGTSQEGAEKETIQQIALYNKMAGADIHHIGDAGMNGIAIPERIMDYSITIRGKRHTYTRMAASVRR